MTTAQTDRPPPRIRPATAADAAAIASVHVASWQAAYAGLLPEDYLTGLSTAQREERWRGSLTSGQVRVFVAEADQVVGFAAVGASRDKDVRRRPVGELYALYVHPDCWGRGVGGMLHAAALQALRDEGFPEATLWVLDGNARARRFYEGHQWLGDGGRRHGARAGVDTLEVRYRRALGPA